MTFYKLIPEVAGGFGPGTILDRSVWPPIVTKLHYKMQGRLGDELLEFMSCYIATEPLIHSLKKANLTGFSEAGCEVSYPGHTIPKFLRINFHGIVFTDDFGLIEKTLVASSKAWEVLSSHQMDNCDRVIQPCGNIK